MQILQEQMIPFKSQKQHQIGILATIHLGYLQTWVKSGGLKLPKKRNKYCKTWLFFYVFQNLDVKQPCENPKILIQCNW